MPVVTGSLPVFAPGVTAVRRDILNGRVWTAAPHRVLADSGGELVLACWPGIASLVPGTSIESWRDPAGAPAARRRSVDDLAGGRWELGRWTWAGATVLSWIGLDADFSVHRFSDAAGRLTRWYVNFERPPRRTPIGIDTLDLMIDLVVEPGLGGWRWKDEDEYAQARRLGLIGDAEHSRVQQARERAVAMIRAGGGPFGRDVRQWSDPRGWPLPELPPEALTVPG